MKRRRTWWFRAALLGAVAIAMLFIFSRFSEPAVTLTFLGYTNQVAGRTWSIGTQQFSITYHPEGIVAVHNAGRVAIRHFERGTPAGETKSKLPPSERIWMEYVRLGPAPQMLQPGETRLAFISAPSGNPHNAAMFWFEPETLQARAYRLVSKLNIPWLERWARNILAQPSIQSVQLDLSPYPPPAQAHP